MSSSPSNFLPSTLQQSSSNITVGNVARVLVTHQAQTFIPTTTNHFHLNVLVSPSLTKHLISICRLTHDNNVSIEFDPSRFSIKDLPTKAEMLQCESSNDLYPLRLPHHQALHASSATSLWHQHLVKPSHPSTSQVMQKNHCNKVDARSCSSCRLGKHTHLPFADSTSQTFFPFQLVHSDVWMFLLFSYSGYKYFVIYLDDYTHYLWTIPL